MGRRMRSGGRLWMGRSGFLRKTEGEEHWIGDTSRQGVSTSVRRPPLSCTHPPMGPGRLPTAPLDPMCIKMQERCKKSTCKNPPPSHWEKGHRGPLWNVDYRFPVIH